MAAAGSDTQEVNARIVYWGIDGGGKSTNLRTIYNKLRSDHRGELREVPTRLDPTVTYEVLPISLGEVKGVKTQLQIVAVPGGDDHVPTRKQLLDRVHGLVLVLDAQQDRIEGNIAAFEELKNSLAAYGRRLQDVPIVVQYNKRDLADPFTIEALHRQLDLAGVAVFETVATDGSGVLQTLTTISKRVIRVLREQGEAERHGAGPLLAPQDVLAPAEATPAARTEPILATSTPTASHAVAPSGAAQLMERAILAEADEVGEGAEAANAALEAQTLLDRPFEELAALEKPAAGLRIGPDLKIVSTGAAARVGQRSVRIPLVLGNSEGDTATLALTIALDPLLDEDT